MVASADRKRISVTRAMRELDAGDGRAVDRRLAVAVGASIIIHALAVTSLRTLIPPPTAQDVGAPNNFAVLQAVLAGPRVEVDAEQLTPLEQPAPPALFLPPALLPIETASQRARVALAPPPGPVPQPGTDHPQVIISVKIIDDPSWLGSRLRALARAAVFAAGAEAAGVDRIVGLDLSPRGARCGDQRQRRRAADHRSSRDTSSKRR